MPETGDNGRPDAPPPAGDAAAAQAIAAAEATHAPVMRAEVVQALQPGRGGVYLDGTFGLGGYARALLDAGADLLIGVDRDPDALARARGWAGRYAGRLLLVEAPFSEVEAAAAQTTGVPAHLVLDGALAPGRLSGAALDLGVSSLQLDQAERGFSFLRDGPLDMRMGADAERSAADLVNSEDEATLADILFYYGEERAARRIARRIVAARAEETIATTVQLADLVASVLPRPKPGQPHPATRSFQALRIAVNRELGELVDGLAVFERLLEPGGTLAVVSFHSLEDRIVKRFIADRAGRTAGPSRHAPPKPPVNPETPGSEPSFTVTSARPVIPSAAEVAENPRARSAKLRVARRSTGAARPVEAGALGLPLIGTAAGGAMGTDKRRRRRR